jgi:pimeloyl-ACP methyl ester carboxylesterase
MEPTRQALRFSRSNLLRISYGTRVAQVYGYLHPERLSVLSARGQIALHRFALCWDTSYNDHEPQLLCET